MNSLTYHDIGNKINVSIHNYEPQNCNLWNLIMYMCCGNIDHFHNLFFKTLSFPHIIWLCLLDSLHFFLIDQWVASSIVHSLISLEKVIGMLHAIRLTFHFEHKHRDMLFSGWRSIMRRKSNDILRRLIWIGKYQPAGLLIVGSTPIEKVASASLHVTARTRDGVFPDERLFIANVLAWHGVKGVNHWILRRRLY